MEKERGFVTLAVGDEKYYRLAANLLKSYRYHTNSTVPFAIIADRENEYTKLFDKTIILENPTYSYMDKIEMLNHPPYEDNIFLDSDCLIYRDINVFWEYVKVRPQNMQCGVYCFGKKHPLDFNDGWFKIGDIGEYKDQVHFIPTMHGGIIFFHNDDLTKQIYSLSLEIIKNYSKYKFKYFNEPADEPVLALAMSICNSSPLEISNDLQKRAYVFYPTVKYIKCDILNNILKYSNDGINWIENVILIHWQNYFTETPLYYKEVLKLKYKRNKIKMYILYILYIIKYHIKRNKNRIINRIERRIGK